MKLELQKNLLCSSAHITEKEMEYFCWHPNSYMQGKHSWIVSIFSLKEYDLPALKKPSAGLKKVIALAEKNGAHYVIFDSDGPVIKGVPTYKW